MQMNNGSSGLADVQPVWLWVGCFAVLPRIERDPGEVQPSRLSLIQLKEVDAALSLV